MGKNSNKRLIETIVISGLGVAIGYIINFLVTPYITEHLGVEAYGFVSIANSVVSYAGILTIALTSFIVRFISVSYHENKISEAKSYFSSSVYACVLLSVVILAVSFLMIWKLEYLLNIPDQLVVSVKILFLVVFLNFVVNTCSTPYNTAAYIKNRLDLVGILKIVGKIIEAIIIAALFFFLPPEVWYVALGALVSTLLVFFGCLLMTKKLTPELKFAKLYVSKNKIIILVKNGVWDAFNQLGNVLNSGLDLIIANLMLTGVETGQIAIVKTVGTIFSTLFQTVYQPFQPTLLKSYADGSGKSFLKEMSKAMRICGFFGALAFAGFVALGKLYYQLWMPTQDSDMLLILTIITVMNNITDSILRPVYYVSTLTVKNKIPCWVTIAGGVLNDISMYFLIKYTNMGIYAVVITTAVIMISINLFFNPIYAAKCLNMSSGFFYKILTRHIFGTIVMTAVFKIISNIFSPSTWLGLIFVALTMCVIGLIIYFYIMCNSKEREHAYRYLKIKLGRIGGK